MSMCRSVIIRLIWKLKLHIQRMNKFVYMAAIKRKINDVRSKSTDWQRKKQPLAFCSNAENDNRNV